MLEVKKLKFYWRWDETINILETTVKITTPMSRISLRNFHFE